jgi:hypothetical protein
MLRYAFRRFPWMEAPTFVYRTNYCTGINPLLSRFAPQAMLILLMWKWRPSWTVLVARYVLLSTTVAVRLSKISGIMQPLTVPQGSNNPINP